jgi:hypothetical protein
MKTEMTQYERSRALREQLKELFPELSRAHESLRKLLDEAQNGPPDGDSDGSIDEIQYAHLRSIERNLQAFLAAQLFDRRVP